MPDQDELEFLVDARTLWVNGRDGLIGRFGVFGIDIHLAGSCKGGYCTHQWWTTNEDWEVFKQKMLEIHNVVVSDEHKPDRLTVRESSNDPGNDQEPRIPDAPRSADADGDRSTREPVDGAGHEVQSE